MKTFLTWTGVSRNIKAEPPIEYDLPHAYVYTYAGQLAVIPKAGGTTPPPPPPPTEFPNVRNGDFEGGLTDWVAYRMDGPVSELLYELRDLDAPGMDVLAVHHDPQAGYIGRKAIMLSFFHNCWRGGVYQTLVNVPIGAHVRVGLWAISYGSNFSGVRNVDVNMNSFIGIGFDPLGLVDPNAGRVDWKMITGGNTVGNIGGGRDPLWQYVSHECVTTTGALTIFLNANLGKTSATGCQWAFPYTRAHFDDVTLEVL